MVNRCQQDIAQRRSIREARQSELEFFRHHPSYGEVAQHCGTEALGWTVSRILGEHISELLPALTDKIVARRNEGTRVRLSQIPRRLFHLSAGDCFISQLATVSSLTLVTVRTDYSDYLLIHITKD